MEFVFFTLGNLPKWEENTLKGKKLYFYYKKRDVLEKSLSAIYDLPTIPIDYAKNLKIPPLKEGNKGGVFCYWFPKLFGIDEVGLFTYLTLKNTQLPLNS